MDLKEMLQKGDIRSDGLANDVVGIVFNNPLYFDELFDCLRDPEDSVRAHASDALEKILRKNKYLIIPKISIFLDFAREETLPIVKLHYSMITAYIYTEKAFLDDIIELLFQYLRDESIFVATWTISSLTIIALAVESKKNMILKELQTVQFPQSKALHNRLHRAIILLTKGGKIPKAWIKIENIK